MCGAVIGQTGYDRFFGKRVFFPDAQQKTWRSIFDIKRLKEFT
jgi:hypothetical protein